MKNYKNHSREDATMLGEMVLLPIVLLILLSFATMWAVENKPITNIEQS